MAGHIKATTRNGLLQSPTQWLFEHQIGASFSLIFAILLSHASFPHLRPSTSKFFILSGFNPATGKYAIGHADLHFVAFCVTLFIGIRAGAMKYLLAPLARSCGLTSKKRIARFSEQGWMFMYNAIFWTLGMRIYISSPYFLNMEELWTNYPQQRELEGVTKAYLLAQLAYWIQQVLVVHLEARRHDYHQMIAHHVATIALVTTAYVHHHSRVTNLIFVLMDIIELIFPLAKCLKALGFTTICDIIFGIFMVTWFVTRHIFYLMVCWSVYADLPRIMPPSCYTGVGNDMQGPLPVPDNRSYLLVPFRDSSGIMCTSDGISTGFLAYLLTLQAIMIPWSAAIVRVALQVVRGDSAEDVRSDDEDEENDIEGDEKDDFESTQMVEEEVTAEDVDFEAWKRRHGVKQTATTSGASLSRHSDRKELLNRIGCERQID
ncbi:longevity-assurance protein [Hypoxylon argillaceum]|nr:longevity-assurance protein [Hypoxylon argillaceum]